MNFFALAVLSEYGFAPAKVGLSLPADRPARHADGRDAAPRTLNVCATAPLSLFATCLCHLQVKEVLFERDVFVENDGMDDARRVVHFWELRFAAAAAAAGAA